MVTMSRRYFAKKKITLMRAGSDGSVVTFPGSKADFRVKIGRHGGIIGWKVWHSLWPKPTPPQIPLPHKFCVGVLMEAAHRKIFDPPQE